MSKLLKKGSKAAKAWGAKMRRLRGGKRKRKTTTRKRRTTRKGDLTLKRKKAYSRMKFHSTRGITLKRKRKSNKPRKRRSSSMKLPKFGGTLKKVAIGVGAASLASLAIGFIAPQYAGIARPIAAFMAGGVPGVAGELVLDQGLLGNLGGMISGAPNVQNGGQGL
jgi:hypothetical protein